MPNILRQDRDAKWGEFLLSGDLHLGKKPHETGSERINLKFKFRAPTRGPIQNRSPFRMNVQHGVVVLVKTDDMGERGHDRFQFGESLSVRAGDPQPRRGGSADLKSVRLLSIISR